VFVNFKRARPAFFDGIAQAVQRADAGIASPGKNQFPDEAHSDHLVVENIGRHADQGEIAAILADDFMARGKGDEVRESFEGDGVAIVDEPGDCLLEA
jgi:hypothetical protein